ncbi:hypothetical protein I601_3827 [Nocardioides dokdonensis FR1436]|uniref:HNH nuclease domain-containing protein n=1 Tax=Nocardioides dokdonensis FR1436 TaxID=1300347 RepID=A0A1A9GQ76_9ACTN|nr:HNH endonuclease signature motif containing protein [Nocardioides dokdonensis]ANH40226.1 hypothetical protein I601_3827 [Nocardioides dokdonensis FR1436]
MGHASKARDRAEVDLYEATVAWAVMHSTYDDRQAAVLPGTDMMIELAGLGAPKVSEFAIIEYGTALGMSSDAAVRYIAHVVEIRYRLPRLHAQVVSGRVPVWRASRVAEATLGLPPEGAAFVDQHLAPVAATLSYAGIDRLVEEARARFDPEEAEERRLIAAETRNLAIHLASATAGGQQVDGTVDITGNLALAGSDQPLDVRRSQAVGVLARAQTTLDLTSDESDRVPARQVVLNVHLTDQALRGVDPTTTGAGIHLARIEKTRSLTTIDQVAEWLRTTGTQVAWRTITDQPSSQRGGIDAEAFEHPFRTQPPPTGPRRQPAPITSKDIRWFADHPGLQAFQRRPVDLTTTETVDGYEIPERLAEQTRQRHPRCTFPHCTRRARRRKPGETHLDVDHINAYDPTGPPGQTNTHNLATLCRRHHRAKTHTAWTYRPTPTGFLWTSPQGYQYLVEPLTTTDLGRAPRPGAPPPT